MRFKLDINYSGEELRFLEEHSGGVYIAEIMDDETSSLVWAVLQKWKGIYHFRLIMRVWKRWNGGCRQDMEKNTID